MEPDYDQILAKRPQSSDAVVAWHQVSTMALTIYHCVYGACELVGGPRSANSHVRSFLSYAHVSEYSPCAGPQTA